MARGYNRLPLAAALLAAASSANAGISIPAGDWTLDIGGVVNAFYTSTKTPGSSASSNIGTGLLPNVLAVGGTTRQNDLDVSFLIALDPGGYSNHSLSGGSAAENRQAFFTFGDKSWGTVKIGKDLGIFASDAILNDMTLLGVGWAAPGQAGSGGGTVGAGTTTLGGIGAGYLYADWKQQIAYTTPNMNGFQATVGITQGYNAVGTAGLGGGVSSSNTGGSQPAFEGKVSYDFAADAVKGRVWASGFTQVIQGGVGAPGAAAAAATSSTVAVAATQGTLGSSQTATVGDIGATINAAGFGLTGYYYNGQGVGSEGMLLNGLSATGQKRDSSGGYVQATYVLPTATKLGVAWGESKIDAGAGDATTYNYKNERWTVGAYHPLTKHVNLVAEYNNEKVTTSSVEVTTNTVSLGGILFF